MSSMIKTVLNSKENNTEKKFFYQFYLKCWLRLSDKTQRPKLNSKNEFKNCGSVV